jgi:hypothetical protein
MRKRLQNLSKVLFKKCQIDRFLMKIKMLSINQFSPISVSLIDAQMQIIHLSEKQQI